VFVASNSTLTKALGLLLESVHARALLLSASLTLMAVSATALGAWAWTVQPPAVAVRLRRVPESFWASTAEIRDFPGPWAKEIVIAVLLRGRAPLLAEASFTDLAPRLQLGLASEFKGNFFLNLLRVEVANLGSRPRWELSSRTQVEVHASRALLHLGSREAF